MKAAIRSLVRLRLQDSNVFACRPRRHAIGRHGRHRHRSRSRRAVSRGCRALSRRTCGRDCAAARCGGSRGRRAAGARLLPVGAQSSLTGGATPSGDLVLSTERLTGVRRASDRVIVGAGVTLHELQESLTGGSRLAAARSDISRRHGRRSRVDQCGRRGHLQVRADAAVGAGADGGAAVRRRPASVAGRSRRVRRRRRSSSQTSAGDCTIRVPDMRMPDVPKRSAGYHSAPHMDLVDLFIGAEGTLGVIVEAELRVQPRPAAVCWVMIPLTSEPAAIALTADAPRGGDRNMAHRRSARYRSVGDRAHRSAFAGRRARGRRRPASGDHAAASRRTSCCWRRWSCRPKFAARDLWRDLQNAIAEDCRGHAAGAALSTARPSRRAAGHRDRVAGRHAARGGIRRAARGGAVGRQPSRVAGAIRPTRASHKTAADMIVPYAQFDRMMRACREMCAAANLDIAVWGHISDGNVHPNIIPRSYEDVERGRRDAGRAGAPRDRHGRMSAGRARRRPQSGEAGARCGCCTARRGSTRCDA